MAPLRRFVRRLTALFRQERAEVEIERELSAHLGLIEDDLVRKGMTRESAHATARRVVGGVEQIKDRHRDARSFVWLENLRCDVRYSLRALGRAPGFTAVVVGTLGLGIGASVSVFSLVYGVLMRPLPYRDAERIVTIDATQRLEGVPRPLPAAFSFDTLAATAGKWQSFERFVYSASSSATLAGPQGAEVINTAIVSRGFMASLGAKAILGRPLAADDDLSPVVVISESLWARIFSRSPAALGQSLVLQSIPHTVVGVVDSSFQLPRPDAEAWLPLGFLQPRSGARGYSLRPVATLRAGVSLETARSEVAAWAHTLASDRQYATHRVALVRLLDEISSEARKPLLVLFAAVSLLLIVACANVAGLLLSRGASRVREWEVRSALGASLGRLTAQRVTEVGILAAGGTLAGLLVAALVVRLLPRVTASIPRLDAVDLDAAALAWAAGVAVLVTVVTGAFSAFRAPWSRVARPTESPAARRVRSALCVCELAIALVLLIGAGLLGRTLTNLLAADLGATTERVTSASLFFPGGVRQPDARVRDIARRIEERVRAVPGVQEVGLGTSLPIGGSRIRITLVDESKSLAAMATGVPATPGYFRALGMRLVEGRFFTDADDDQHPEVGILTEETARRYFPDGALGRKLSLPVLRAGVGAGQIDVTIVGVVKNVKYSTVDAAPEDAMYRPFAQQAWGSPFLVVRTTTDPRVFSLNLRREIAAVDPEIVVSRVRPLTEVVRASIAGPQFRALVFGGLAFAAVLLAAIGLFGAMAYSVSKRTAEIGVRMALGATHGDVLRMVLKEAAAIIAAGAAAGVALSLLTTRMLASLLYEVAPTDLWSLVGGCAALTAVALCASYLPARRATLVDPLMALRHE